VAIGLAAYRIVTLALGPPLAGLFGGLGPIDGVWRGGFRGAGDESRRAAGSVWVHAASMGEAGMARTWIEALLAHGERSPVLMTTRTRTGLARARGEMGDRAAVRIAPHDLPRVVGALLDSARPRRVDVIETEIWPNMILEARRRSAAVVFVSAAVSERSARRLRMLGIAGRALLGEGVYALPQSESHASRFESLGIPRERVRVMGDLKAGESARAEEDLQAFGSRPALVFGSMRPGEEKAVFKIALQLEAYRMTEGKRRLDPEGSRDARGAFEGRSRALLVIAPRHAEGEARARAAFGSSGFELAVRDEAARDVDVRSWIDEVSRRPGPRAALLATRGELARAYGAAWGAVIGGTLAPFGGHNVWEPAARGCPVLVGPHHDQVATAIDAIVAEGGGAAAIDAGGALLEVLESWLRDPDLERTGAAAARAAVRASGAAARGIEGLAAWGLLPRAAAGPV
jgi:3-deoxy-D-manno-octulosonic-acid transferase